MQRVEKQACVDALKRHFESYDHFYVINTESLTVSQMNALRRACFQADVLCRVAKNTLIRRAVADQAVEGVETALHGVSALLFANDPKVPATILSEFRKTHAGDRPRLKLACVEGALYIGDEQLVMLTSLKTKRELLGELVGLLQSPLTGVLSMLRTGPTIGALVAALQKRSS